MSTSVKLGLAAIVLGLAGWLVARGFPDGSWWRVTAYAPAICLAGLAGIGAVVRLLAGPDTPDKPLPPREMNVPRTGDPGVYIAKMKVRQRQYEQELDQYHQLLASSNSPTRAASYFLSAVASIGILSVLLRSASIAT